MSVFMKSAILSALFRWIDEGNLPQLGKNLEGRPTYAFSYPERGLIVSFKQDSVLALIRDGKQLREEEISDVDELSAKLKWVKS